MKHKIINSLSALALICVGCESDLDKITVSGLEAATIAIEDGADLVLTADKADETAAVFNWTDSSELTVSNEAVSVSSDIITCTLEVYTSDDNCTTVGVSGTTHTFTHAELNTVVRKIGVDESKLHAVYFRLASALGTNVESKYSNVITLNIQSYYVDMSYGTIYGKNGDGEIDEDSPKGKLYSPSENGIYTGFIGATGWMNCFFKTNDNAVWGNENVNWTAFEIMQDGGNMWYPEPAGCYYTEVNTNDLYWSATLISELNLVSGSATEALTYLRAENRWYAVVDVEAGTQFSIAGTTQYYDKNTGDSSYTDGTCTIGASDGNIEWQGEGAITIDKAGTYTISLYMGDLTYKVTEGEEEIAETAPAQLYLLGINDDWDFNLVLPCTDEDNWLYTGVVGVASCPWGYYFGTENGNWSDVYQLNSDGLLELNSTLGNIAFNESAGIYIWEVDLKNLTFTTTEVTSVSMAGFNDVWDLTSMTQAENDPLVFYYNDYEIGAVSSWGGQFLLNDSWDTFVGGSGTTMEWNTNCTYDATVGTGTYSIVLYFETQTIDFSTEPYEDVAVEETYPEQLYVVGIDYDWSTFIDLPSTSDGVYSTTLTITGGDTNYLNFEVYDDQAWTKKYGPADNDGNLTTGSSAWQFWVDAAGTYTLTIDLTAMTYTLTASE